MNANSIYFDGTRFYSIGNLGNIRSLSFKIAPLTTSQALIVLSSTISITLVSGIITITGAIGTIYVDGVVNGTFVAKDFKSISIIFDTEITADAVVFGANFNGYLNHLSFYTDEIPESLIQELK